MSRRRDKVKVIITLDLDSRRRPNYYRLNRQMNNLGFYKFTRRNVSLPHNTYYGEFYDEDLDITQLKRDIWDLLENLNLHPRRLFGGILESFSLSSRRRRRRRN